MSDIIPQDTPESNHTPKTTFIYALIDPTDQAIRYVGKSDNPHMRLQEHLRKKTTTHKGRWINKLISQGFTPRLKILEEIPVEIWPERECFWIDFFRSQGYDLTNTTGGGIGGKNLSPEVRAKISAKNRGRKASPEQIANMAAGHRGKPRSPQAIAKMANNKRGKKRPPFSDEWKRNLSESKKGKTPSPETRAKLSMVQKGRKRKPLSEEHKQRIIEANTGRKHTPETKAKISAAQRDKPRKALSEEHKLKIGESSRGRKHTPESIAKMSEIARKRWSMRKANPPDSPTLF